MRLMDGFVNREYRIEKIHAQKREVHRLARMHIKEGSVLCIIARHKGYPFLVEVEGTRIAFDKDVACAIEVIPYV